MIRKSLLAFVASVAVLLPSPGFGQEGSPGLYVETYTVAPGMTAQFEEVSRQIHEAYKQTGAAPQTAIGYTTAAGGGGRTYIFAVPFTDWDALDAFQQIPDVLAEAYGEEEAAKILMAGDAAFSTAQTTISLTQVDASSGTAVDPTAAIPALATVIRTEVDLSLLSDYNLFLVKLKEAEEAAGVSWIRRQTVRGPLNVFTSVNLHNTFADAAPNAYDLLRDHLGSAEADPLIERQLVAVQHREIQTLAHRPDLSRTPAN